MLASMRNFTIQLICLSGLLLAGCADNTEVTSRPDPVFVAPTKAKPGRLNIEERVCYFSDVDSAVKKMDIILDSADAREIELVNSIMQYAGLPSNFSIYRGNIDNALATMVNNQRLIIYNKDLFATLDRLSNTYWSSVFILAHEIGHHLAYNISDTIHTIKAELDADIFAASILYKMGADTAQTILAVNSRFISNTRDTKTHPSKAKRIEAIRQSWINANQLGKDMAIPPQPYDQDAEIHIGIEELWNNPNTEEEIDTLNLKVSADIYAVVLKRDYNKFGRENNGNHRRFQVLLQILAIDPNNKNELEFNTGERCKLDIFYIPYGSDGEDADYVNHVFCEGRRIQFTAYEYTDNIGGNRRIVEVTGAKQ